MAEAREVAEACAQQAIERKGRDVRVLAVGDRISLTEWFVLASVNNRRHARAVREGIRGAIKELGRGSPLMSSEDPDGRWSLYDYGDVVVHLFDDEGRRYFDLDGMWADAEELQLRKTAG